MEKFPIIENPGNNRSTKIVNNGHVDYIYAGVLYWLADDLEKQSQATAESLKSSYEKFSVAIGKSNPTPLSLFTIPPYDPATIEHPNMGPLKEFGEAILEKYCRVNALLKSFQNVTGISKWRDTFQDKEAAKCYPSASIPATSLPTWMLTAIQSSKSVTVDELTRFPALSRKVFQLVRDTASKDKYTAILEKHVNDFIEFEGLRLPEASLTADRDPREYPDGAMWRDTLRRQLDFPKLRVDFLRIDLGDQFRHARNTLYHFYNQEDAKPWSSIQHIFADNNTDHFELIYTLRVVEEAEEDFDWEYSGAPLAIQQDFRVTRDNDIAERHDPAEVDTQKIQNALPEQPKAADSPRVDPPGSQTTTQEERDKRQFQKIKEFLSGGQFQSSKVVLTPGDLFNPEEKTEMLQYHDNFEVTSKQGLLDWQRYVLDQVCGVIPAPIKRKSILKISRAAGSEIDNLRAEADMTALSADVSSDYIIPIFRDA
jgi:hypothetical protein